MKRREFVIASSLAMSAVAFGDSAQGTRRYVCPPCGCTHDGVVHDEPGNCPACGMALVGPSSLDDLTAIRNFLRLSGQVWTGGQPSLEHLSKLKQEGIKVIINLRQHGEHNGELEAANAKELGLSYFNVPVVYNAPQAADVDDFLKLTDGQLQNGPVFIHCTAAIRVGAFWMIRRVLRDGWTYDQAFEEANRIGLTNQRHLIDFAREYIEDNQK